MTPLWMWLRFDLRRRWLALAGLVLLIALSAATVLAAFAGARRGMTAQARLDARTEPATSAVLANTPGFDWTKVERLPDVAALTRFVVDYSIQLERVPTEVLSFPPDDDATMRSIERPVVFAGRVFNPARPDEVDVSRKFVSTFHLGVGDAVVLHLPTESEVMNSAPAPYHGPVVTEHIVGVVESPWFSDNVGSPGAMFLSPGLARTYPGSILGDQSSPKDPNFVNALVRLRGGEAAIPQFRRDLARVTGRSDLDVWNLPDQARQTQRNIEFESWCLIVFGLVALAAALFLAGQAISRFAQAEVQSLRTMQAMGMTRNEVTSAATAAPALAGLVGAVGGVVGAYLASTWFPIGSAGLLEPTPGRSWDWLVLTLGAVVTVAMVVVGVALTTRRALGARVARTDRSMITEMVARGAGRSRWWSGRVSPWNRGADATRFPYVPPSSVR